MSASNDHLREKIDEAKRLLPMPKVLEKFGLGAHAKKEARCPFPDHEDKHPSFSIWQVGGAWFWKCHSKCGSGDEISFIQKYKGLSRSAAIGLYLEMAGFPPAVPMSRKCPKSHKYPESLELRESHKFPKSPVYPVCPVSNGQGLDGEKEKVLKALAARNACTERNAVRTRRFKLARDLIGLEKGIGRELDITELMPAFDEWHRLSQPFLDPAKTREAYLAAFLAELRKVRIPTGEGDTLKKALECVSKLVPSQLPVIPGMQDAPENWRRLAALHRELSCSSAHYIYFLSYRAAAKVSNDLTQQKAHTMTGALVTLGVIEIVSKGKAGLKSGEAAEFRYLLPQSENGAEENDEGIEI